MKECKMCGGQIKTTAKICKHCGSDQRGFHSFIKATGLINIVSIVVLGLSFIQYNNARREKVLAQEAKDSAQTALQNIDSLGNHIERLAKLYTEISFIEANNYTILASGAILYPDNFRNKLDSLMQLIESDSIKRKHWIETLNRSK